MIKKKCLSSFFSPYSAKKSKILFSPAFNLYTKCFHLWSSDMQLSASFLNFTQNYSFII